MTQLEFIVEVNKLHLACDRVITDLRDGLTPDDEQLITLNAWDFERITEHLSEIRMQYKRRN